MMIKSIIIRAGFVLVSAAVLGSNAQGQVPTLAGKTEMSVEGKVINGGSKQPMRAPVSAMAKQ